MTPPAYHSLHSGTMSPKIRLEFVGFWGRCHKGGGVAHRHLSALTTLQAEPPNMDGLFLGF